MSVMEKAKKANRSGLVDNVRTIAYALLIALIIRAVLFQPFNIPSSSMVPTLLVGDYLFVSKYAYGYSRHSFPTSPPIFDGRLLAREPRRGDVVVFKLPTDNSTDYIKRLVGLPGDRIQMKEGVLHINDTPVERETLEDFLHTDGAGNQRAIRQYLETLPNGVSHLIHDWTEAGYKDNTRIFVVPDGHYFMMGDNRDNSTDSRFLNQVGFVPEENLVGRAEIIFFSTNGSARFWEFWKWPTSIRWGRLFDSVD